MIAPAKAGQVPRMQRYQRTGNSLLPTVIVYDSLIVVFCVNTEGADIAPLMNGICT